jgi:hypothetical protein
MDRTTDHRLRRAEQTVNEYLEARCPRCGNTPSEAAEGLGEGVSAGSLVATLLRQGQRDKTFGEQPLTPNDRSTALGGALGYIADVVLTTGGGLALPSEDRERVRAALADILARADDSP